MRSGREVVAHDAVVRRVELDVVDPVAPPVVRLQLRRDRVRQIGVMLEIRAADEPADPLEFGGIRLRGERAYRIDEGDIG